MSRRWIVMLGTAFNTKGGISSVLNAYQSGGLFDRWAIRYIETHRDGPAWSKFTLALSGFIYFVGLTLIGKVAAVHVHAASRMSFWRKSPFLLLAFLTGRSVVFHLHGGGFREFYERDCGALARLWIRAVLGHSERVIVLSASWQSWVNSITPNARTRVIPNPAPSVKPISPKLVKDDPMLLFSGAIHESKGVFDLLRVVASLRHRYPRIRLVLAGTGPAIELVKKRVEAFGITAQLELLGWVDAQTRDALLQEADVFVLPSYYEGLPMSVLEAMAAGLPVVASKVGGIPEVIEHMVDGWLVTAGDVPAIRVALEMLLADAVLRETMGIAAQQRVQRYFSLELVLEQIEDIYRELVGTNIKHVENNEMQERRA